MIGVGFEKLALTPVPKLPPPLHCSHPLSRYYVAHMFLLTIRKTDFVFGFTIDFWFQLMYGANDQLLKDMKIERNPSKYHYIIQGGDPKVVNSFIISIWLNKVMVHFLLSF